MPRQIQKDNLDKFMARGTIWQHIRLDEHKHTDIHIYTGTYYCKKSEKVRWKE